MVRVSVGGRLCGLSELEPVSGFCNKRTNFGSFDFDHNPNLAFTFPKRMLQWPEASHCHHCHSEDQAFNITIEEQTTF